MLLGIYWMPLALSDLSRLYDFLAMKDRIAAAKVVSSLVQATQQLQEYPKIWEPLERFSPRDVRKVLIGTYEMRYEITKQRVSILRIWHTREQR